MKRIVIAGAGALGRELAGWTEDIIGRNPDFEIGGFIDDTMAPCGQLSEAYPYPVLDSIAAYEPAPGDQIIVAIAKPAAKLQVARALDARGASFFRLVHPTSVVARTARLGRGVVLCPFALASADCTIGDFVTINAYSSIGHDASVGAGATISSHVDVTGRVKIDTGAFIGSGASILPDTTIGAFSTVGAGSIVVRSVPEHTTVYAAPAKRL